MINKFPDCRSQRNGRGRQRAREERKGWEMGEEREREREIITQ